MIRDYKLFLRFRMNCSIPFEVEHLKHVLERWGGTTYRASTHPAYLVFEFSYYLDRTGVLTHVEKILADIDVGLVLACEGRWDYNDGWEPHERAEFRAWFESFA